MALKTQIEEVSSEVTKILANKKPPLELDDYLKKLTNTKNKITVVTNILQATQVKFYSKITTKMPYVYKHSQFALSRYFTVQISKSTSF